MSVRKAFDIRDQLMKAAKDCGEKAKDGRLLNDRVQFTAHLNTMTAYWDAASYETTSSEYSKYCNGVSRGLQMALATFNELGKLEELTEDRMEELFGHIMMAVLAGKQ